MNNRLHIARYRYELKKEQEVGEKELIALASEADVEAEWFYDRDASYWFYFTSIPIVEGTRIGIQSSAKPLCVLGENITHYHIHPRKHAEEILQIALGLNQEKIDALIKNFPTLSRKRAVSKISNIALARHVIPSLNDLFSYFLVFEKNPYVNVHFAVASEYGITFTEIRGALKSKKGLKGKHANWFNDMSVLNAGSLDDEVYKIIDKINNDDADLNVVFKSHTD